MNRVKFALTIIGFLISISFITAQEICDNGIDDDGDGLIDLNDYLDCECKKLVPSSLILNPSFENKTCCPKSEALLSCADSWIQASAGTSDYIHLCGFLGLDIVKKNEPPLPFPHGEACVAFRDGKPFDPKYKEYVGSCTQEPILKGEAFELQFFIGFQESRCNKINITIYGTSSCNNLPFGDPTNKSFGCPSNDPNWFVIAQKVVEGKNEWKKVFFEFTVPKRVEAIAIGGPCGPSENVDEYPYFYLDDIQIQKKSSLKSNIEKLGGFCRENLFLLAKDQTPNTQYQWYKNGIAIVGENTPTLDLSNFPDRKGIYALTTVDIDGNCIFSNETVLQIDTVTTVIDESFCLGSSFFLDGNEFKTAGTHRLDLETDEGCDSTVILRLEELQPSSFSFQDSICTGGEYMFFDQILTAEGTYEKTLTNNEGCDSTITLYFNLIPYPKGNLDTMICDNETISFGEGVFSKEGTYTIPITNTMGCDSFLHLELSIQNTNFSFDDKKEIIKLGEFLSLDIENNNFSNINWVSPSGDTVSNLLNFDAIPTESGIYILQLNDEFGCSHLGNLKLNVLKNHTIYAPNVISANGDGINDIFSIYGNQVLEIEEISIYDRWGNMVYRNKTPYLPSIGFKNGWDGKIDGVYVQPSVFSWVAKLKLIDGSILIPKGSLTVIR